MEAYSHGDYTAVPSGTYGGTSFSSARATPPPSTTPTRPPRAQGQAGQGRQAASPTAPPTAARAPARAARHRRLERHRHGGPAAPVAAPAAPAPAPAPTRSATPSRASPAPSAAWSSGVTGGRSSARARRPRRLPASARQLASVPEPQPAADQAHPCSPLSPGVPSTRLRQLSLEQHRTPGPRPGVLSFTRPRVTVVRDQRIRPSALDRRPGPDYPIRAAGRRGSAAQAEHPRGVERPVGEDRCRRRRGGSR